MSLNKLAAGVALTTLAILAANEAFAQTTASQVAEVVVTSRAQRSTQGLAVQVQVAKDQSIVTSQYIATQPGSSNVAQLINLLPGVSYSSDDSTGLLSNDLRIHGFDGSRISLTVDGTPLNDSGNYSIYAGEYPVSEVVDRQTVNMGGNEVDSPSPSALGATINIVTKIPQTAPGFQGSASAGNYNYVRGYGEIDTGEFTPWGTRAYFSANYTHADKTKGKGDLKRTGFEGKIYQPLRDKDFISIAGTWVSERSYFYESSSLAQYSLFGYGIDWNTQWAVPSVTPGKADTSGPLVNAQPGFQQAPIPTTPGSSSNAAAANTGQGFWATHPNPVDFGDIRVQSRFDLSHGFTFTFDPYFFYTQANGGGVTALSEKDARLVGRATSFPTCKIGTQASGVDLNGDGDCMDSVAVYSPSNTQTDRFGVNTSLLWDMDQHNHFQLSYGLDYANHRQTGAFGTINQQTGFPTSFFGGLDGQGIYAADGTPIRKRDRFSVAQLNQASFNYIGRWMDDRLHVNLGVRYAMFERHLNQYCYLYNGATEYCDSVDPAAVTAAYNAGVAAHSVTALNSLLGVSVSLNPLTNAPNFRLPFSQVVHYNKAMPNLGASWNFNAQNQVYVSYTQGFAAPKTDNLYTSSSQTVQPETTDIYAGGYRYQGSRFTFTGSLWGSHWLNHIVQSIDPNDPTLSIDRNVGGVTLYGIDAEAGLKVTEHASLYASYTWEHSQLDDNYTLSAGGKPIALPVKGKALVLTPDMMGALRAQFTQGPFALGIQGKYTGPRYIDDMNTQSTRIPGYATADLDVTYAVPSTMGHVLLQFNATNLFNTHYFARASTVSSTSSVSVNGVTYNPSTAFYYTGDAPSLRGTIKVKF